jgi:chromosomal replication initiator protein
MYDKVWRSVLAEIEVNVSHGNFVTWFKNTRLVEEKDGHVTIAVPNVFARQQFEIRYNDTIKELLVKHGIDAKRIAYTFATKQKQTTEPERKQSLPAIKKSGVQKLQLNDKYNFDTFIVGSSNELAHAACQAIAANPGTKYNPMFIYGGVGLGKTHLIQAVGNGIKQNDPSANIVYISTETFVSEFLDSIRFKKQGFADKYRNADVLIVDDIQFIAGKEKTQEEFFHTFNALHQSNKQIILSSDKSPKAIPTLEERLRSRFEWGMAIDIQAPDFETRQAILQAKAQALGVVLEPQVIEYLAKNIQTNIRELEGALNQLLAFCELRQLEPDLLTAQSLLKGRQHRPRSMTPRMVVERTAQHFDISVKEVTGPKRDKDIVLPRQVAMYLLRNELHLSFPKIAHELGRSDHTTALHSVGKIEQLLTADYVMRQHVEEIKELLHV